MTRVTVTTYLLDRLAEAGVDRMFGVPGDFTLAMLDDVDAHPSVDWVGCANELGAGYAADGYARIRGLGAVCTTFGVGELSAINAVAGAAAEHVPLLHIVGAPTLATQAAGRATHHTLGDGDFGHFARMTAEVTIAQASLTVENAAAEIDRVLRAVLAERRPGYLVIPAEVGTAMVDAPGEPLLAATVPSEAAEVDRLRTALAGVISADASVSVLADVLVQRMGAEAALHRVLALGVPHAASLWGRRVVDESSPHYAGPYVGAVSAPETRAVVEEADVLVLAGVQFTDLMSGFFSQRLPATTVEIGPRSTTVVGEVFEGVSMAEALDALAAVLEGAGSSASPRTDAAVAAAPDLEASVGAAEFRAADPTAPLDQAALWSTVAAELRGTDLVIADQGTAFYGMGTHRLPAGALFIGQPLWAAIGYTLPALLGAALAAPDRRPIVLIGDGAAQLTSAELGTMIRQRIPAIVLVVDNAGYTVERAIHGRTAPYNDIASWDWTALVRAVDPSGFAAGYRAETAADVAAAFADHEERGGLTLIQAVVPTLDVPPLLAALAEAAASANRPAGSAE